MAAMSTIRLPVGRDQYRGNFPYIALPENFGEYTVDRERSITLGRSEANYFFEKAMGRVNFDLNLGYEKFEDKDGSDEKLDMLLEWVIRQSPGGKHLKKVLREADVLCWRGLLTKISCTPYESRESWRFYAVRQQGVIFLCEKQTEQKIKREAEMTYREKLMSYWGYKFEQYVTASSLDDSPDITTPVSRKEEFTVITRSAIGPSDRKNSIRLAYGAEVDAIDRDGHLLEMKTQRQELNQGFYRNKSLKWWLQSFFVGIKDIIVGFRDDNGIVFQVDSLPIGSLPSKSQWDGATCLNFLHAVLSAVKSLLTEDGMKCEAFFDLTQIIIKQDQDIPDFLSPAFKYHFHIDEI